MFSWFIMCLINGSPRIAKDYGSKRLTGVSHRRHGFALPFADAFRSKILRMKMNNSIYYRKAVLTLFLLTAFLMSGLPLSAQSVIVYSDITGGSSVFVFKNSAKAATRKFIPQTKSRLSKDQQLAKAKKINRQYVDLAKVAPRRARTTAVDPNTLPPQAKINLMPRDQASKLFAGVGEWYIDREDSDHAEDFFRTAYTLDDKNNIAKNGLSEALALQGNALLVKEDADSAKKKFDEALTFNANNGVAYYGLGEVYNGKDSDKEAIANYEKALDLDHALTAIYVPLGILYYQTGEIAKAETELTRALAISPEDSETQFFYGLVRYAQGNDVEALKAFRAAKAAKPDYAEPWYYTGQTLIRQDKAGEAVKELLKALELKPDYFDAWFSLGTAYFTLEDYPKAIDAYSKAVKFRNSSAEAQANLGDAYRLNNDFRNAEGRYNLANSLAAGDKNYTQADAADVYNKLGYVIARQCDAYTKTNTRCGWQRAVTALEKAVSMSNSQVDYANLGWAYYNAAHNDLNENRPEEGKAKLVKARDALLKAVEGNTTFAQGPLLNLAITYRDMGDNQGAVDTLKRVVARQPDWTFALNELGVAYVNIKDYRSAAEQFRKAINQDGKFAQAYLNLGKAEFLNGNMGEAKKAYDKLKSLDQKRMADELTLFTKGAIRG